MIQAEKTTSDKLNLFNNFALVSDKDVLDNLVDEYMLLYPAIKIMGDGEIEEADEGFQYDKQLQIADYKLSLMINDA
jgi:hypothetical protein